MDKKQKLKEAILSGKVKDEKSALAFVIAEKEKEKLIKEIIPQIKLPKTLKGDPGKDGKDGVDGKDGQKGEKGKDGRNPDVATVVQETVVALEPLVPSIDAILKELPQEGESVRDALEMLTGEERLDKSAIRGLDELVKKTEITKYIGGGSTARAFYQLLDTGSYVGQGGKAVYVKADETGLQFQTAVSSDEKVKYDVNDPTAGYVSDKFVAGTGITLEEGTGTDENKLKISSTSSGASWGSITGDQSLVNVGGFTNDVGYLTTESDPLSLHLDQTTQQATKGTFTFPAIESLETVGVTSAYPGTAGQYSLVGTHNGQNYYQKGFLFLFFTGSVWELSDMTASPTAGFRSSGTTMDGVYDGFGTATGVQATISAGVHTWSIDSAGYYYGDGTNLTGVLHTIPDTYVTSTNSLLVIPDITGITTEVLGVSGGALTWVAGGGSQTPWTSDIDGGGYFLKNIGGINDNTADPGLLSIDPNSRYYYDNSAQIAINLSGTTTNSAIETYEVYNSVIFPNSVRDTSYALSIDPNTRILYATDGTDQVFDYSGYFVGSAYMAAYSLNGTIVFKTGISNVQSGYTVIDPNNDVLFIGADANPDPAITWATPYTGTGTGIQFNQYCGNPGLLKVDGSGYVDIDTTAYLTASSLAVHSKSFVLTNPTSATDGPIWKTPEAITIKAVHVLCVDGTSIDGQIDISDVNGETPVAIDGDITGTAGTNVDDDGSLTAPWATAGSYIGWHTTSVTGTVTKVVVTYEYTEGIPS